MFKKRSVNEIKQDITSASLQNLHLALHGCIIRGFRINAQYTNQLFSLTDIR